jgi:hypothetical protein
MPDRIPPDGTDFGDIDDDGLVTEDDITLIGEYLLDLREFTEEEFKRANLFGDGICSIQNILLIESYIYGLIDTFPVCRQDLGSSTRTYAEIVAQIKAILHDLSNENFTNAEIDSIIPQGLAIVSRNSPYIVPEKLATVPSSRDITLTAGQKLGLIDSLLDRRVEYYPSGQSEANFSEKKYHNFEKNGDVLNLGIDTLPNGNENVYLWTPKIHILQKEIGITDYEFPEE